MDGKRNPYLILGLEFGAAAQEASGAFARCVRRIKTDPSAPYTIEDATWALHQLEHAESDHRTGVTVYRVPADPSVFTTGAAQPAPVPMPRRTAPDPAARDSLIGDVVFDLLEPHLSAIGEMGLDLAYDSHEGSPPARRPGDQSSLPDPSLATSNVNPSGRQHLPGGPSPASAGNAATAKPNPVKKRHLPGGPAGVLVLLVAISAAAVWTETALGRNTSGTSPVVAEPVAAAPTTEPSDAAAPATKPSDAVAPSTPPQSGEPTAASEPAAVEPSPPTAVELAEMDLTDVLPPFHDEMQRIVYTGDTPALLVSSRSDDGDLRPVTVTLLVEDQGDLIVTDQADLDFCAYGDTFDADDGIIIIDCPAGATAHVLLVAERDGQSIVMHRWGYVAWDRIPRAGQPDDLTIWRSTCEPSCVEAPLIGTVIARLAPTNWVVRECRDEDGNVYPITGWSASSDGSLADAAGNDCLSIVESQQQSVTDAGLIGEVFKTPSGNIICVWEGADGLECEILSGLNPQPSQGGCTYARVRLRDDRAAEPLCRGDISFAQMSRDAWELQYGESWERGNLSCVADRSGLFCDAAQGSGGFWLSRDGWLTY